MEDCNCPHCHPTPKKYAKVPQVLCQTIVMAVTVTYIAGLPNHVKILETSYDILNRISKFVTELYCSNNQLTYLDGCPEGVTTLYYSNNPLNSTYANKSLKEIHLINYVKKFKKGITIVDNIILNYNARTIQKVWDDWWYKPDKQGESRVAKKQYAKLNYENNLQNKKISTLPR
uniref:Uncharacterized protein n=1 Tax=Marseillevirus LCMAC102 TaxID=2506603 RepID=A0A481YTB3_9VIRU|nr:MAG: hypothetical protein LCMAC102_02270 [Marseillevirus LCMAC102]